MKKNNDKIINATKWSSAAEIVAKLVLPISNIILARLLTPEDFGVVATTAMVFSFADIFTDSGFQKFLVQHDFSDETDMEESTTVAFWTNFILSLIFWIIISIFNKQISRLVGNSGMGKVLIISCISLPITSLSSIQMALFRRNFDYKTLFFLRIISSLIPLIVTVPIAIFTRSFWALIIGTICGHLSNAIILTLKSSWKPRCFYSLNKLKEMLSFSIWSLIDTIVIWLTGYSDVFIVGTLLSSYYLGIYKTSMNTVNQIMNLIIAATTSILFSALSRQKNDKVAFENTFFSFQRNVALFIFPMGVGIYLYKDLVTKILLGSQWGETAGFIGLWSLVNAFKIILSNYCSEAYRAMGKPRISVFVQMTQLIVLIPMLIYGAYRGFEVLYVMRCLVSIELIIVNLITITIFIKISALKMILNVMPELCSTTIMTIITILLQKISSNIYWSFISIIFSIIVYFTIILLIPQRRQQFIPVLKKLLLTIGNVYKRIKKLISQDKQVV